VVLKTLRRIKPLDRRRHVRLNITCLVRYKIEGSAGACLTNLRDISEGGVLLHVFDEKLVPLTKIQCEFQLPGIGKPISASGIVVRASQNERDQEIAGIQFERIRDSERQKIKEFISKSLKRNG